MSFNTAPFLTKNSPFYESYIGCVDKRVVLLSRDTTCVCIFTRTSERLMEDDDDGQLGSCISTNTLKGLDSLVDRGTIYYSGNDDHLKIELLEYCILPLHH